jgi:pimeloyl-ACP methyl ester carboxylesterase
VIGGARPAARRLFNFATYYVMKNRAALVGRIGLISVLRQVRTAAPDVRIHLIGHSFGARLVTSAASIYHSTTPIASLTLLQAAFSHNGFAHRWDGSHDGAFRQVITEHRVSGPTVITCTKNDRAVGLAYPIASRIAQQTASALGDRRDPYGGLGRNGAQRTPEATDGFLLPVGAAYALSAGNLHNAVADDFISNHGDICSDEVAYLFLAAATAA